MANYEEIPQSLYNAALLGTALSKQMGEVAGQRTSMENAARSATLTAGVASGRIKGQQLSHADASRLAQGVTHVPSFFSNPLGFFAGEARQVGHEAGQIVGSFSKIPQGIASLGEGVGETLKTAVTPPWMRTKQEEQGNKLVKQIKLAGHEIAHPTQHPLGALLNLAAIASPALGGVAKGAGAVSRAAETFPGAEASGVARAAAKVSRLGSVEGRAPVTLSPGMTEKNIEALKALNPNVDLNTVKAAEVPRYYKATAPFVKYAVQKPFDYVLSKAKRLPVPGRQAGNVEEFYGNLFGRRIINRARAQQQAGVNEAFANGPVKDFLETVERMKAKADNPAAGDMQHAAMLLHAMGIDNLDRLDNYAELLRKGEDVDGPVQNATEMQAAQYRANKLFQDDRFRALIENPTDDMKEAAYQLRRVNVHLATIAEERLNPTIHEESGAFGRRKALEDKTVEEMRHELPAWAQAHAPFARGLQAIQDSLMGRETAEVIPSAMDLARGLYIPDKPAVAKTIQEAIDSFKEDRANGESQLDRQEKPGYIAGNTLYQKIATAFQHRFGMEPEQAQALARGVPLGGPGSEIIPTYVPSVSADVGAHFGVQPGGLLRRLIRPTPLDRKGEELPDYYTMKRPFRPRNITAYNVAIGQPLGFSHDAAYTAFMNGSMRMDPEMIARNAYNVYRGILGNKLNDQMIDKIAVKTTDGTVRIFDNEGDMNVALGPLAAKYQFLPVNVWRDFFNEDVQLQRDMADVFTSNPDASPEEAMRQMEEYAEESAQRLVSGMTQKAGMSGKRFGQGVAVPRTFVDTIMKHRQVAEMGTGIARVESYVLSRWKYMQLTMMPAWMMRTSIGHGLIALIDGTMNPTYWVQANRYFSEANKPTEESLSAMEQFNGAGDRVLNPQPLPYAVNQGGMIREMADTGQMKLRQNPMAKLIGSAVHTQTNWQRRAIFLRKLDVEAKQRMAELGTAFDHPGGFMNSKNIDAVLDPAIQREVLKYPGLIENVFDQLSQVSYTFGEMSPWERKLIKFGLPFWGWYKFISKFVWKLPFNYPGRAEAFHMLGNIGNEWQENNLGPIPPYLESALWLSHANPTAVKYINLYGLNPMADVMNPLGRQGMLQGAVRMGQMSPILQSVMAGYGINPLTGQSERIDPRTGIEADRFGTLFNVRTGEELEGPFQANPLQRAFGTFARSFPEVRAVELGLTGGNPVFPESIPLLHEQPIGVQPTTRRGGNLLSALEQEFGAQMRTYNLGKYQANFLKNLAEATRKNPKTIRKEQQKLEE